jgi:hypothetical protein
MQSIIDFVENSDEFDEIQKIQTMCEKQKKRLLHVEAYQHDEILKSVTKSNSKTKLDNIIKNMKDNIRNAEKLLERYKTIIDEAEKQKQYIENDTFNIKKINTKHELVEITKRCGDKISQIRKIEFTKGVTNQINKYEYRFVGENVGKMFETIQIIKISSGNYLFKITCNCVDLILHIYRCHCYYQGSYSGTEMKVTINDECAVDWEDDWNVDKMYDLKPNNKTYKWLKWNVLEKHMANANLSYNELWNIIDITYNSFVNVECDLKKYITTMDNYV